MMNFYAHKVIIVTVLALLVCFIAPMDIDAGDYHNDTSRGSPSDTLACSQCHTMHNSQGGVSLIYSGAGDSSTQYAKLLRAENILSLCLHCHGNKAASPDDTPIDSTGRKPPRVWDTRSLTTPYTPSAGDFMDRGFENEANRHSLGMDITSFEPPGYTAGDWSNITASFSPTFNCLYCHAQHGNENYRNLRYDPGTRAGDVKSNTSRARVPYLSDIAGVFPPTCSDGTATPCDVFVKTTATTAVNSREKYYRESVTFGISTADGDGVNGISTFCGKCHNNFYGVAGNSNVSLNAGTVGDNGANPWVRHPVGDITFSDSSNANNGHIDVANLDNNIEGVITMTRFADGGAGDWPPKGYKDVDAFSGNVDGEQPFCLSCHYAHGGGNSNFTTEPSLDHSNLVFTDSEGDVNIEPDTTYNNNDHFMRNTCNQCHNQ